MMRAYLLAAAGACLLSACAANEPVALVRGLYGEDNALAPGAGYDAYFAQDLAAAMRADRPANGEAGALDFDYRYAAQDMRVRGFGLQGAETDYGYARVVASFRNFGQQERVVWNLCQRPDGAWRIADAGNDGGAPWTLRNLFAQGEDISC